MKYTGYVFESILYDEEKDNSSSTKKVTFKSKKEAKKWLHDLVHSLVDKGYACALNVLDIPVYHKEDDVLDCTATVTPFYTRGEGDIGYLTEKPRKCHWY